jgi:phosphoglycolate phosphatase
MARFTTFLFDLDGTLLDHFAAIHRSHTHTMTTLGLPPPTRGQVHRSIGGGLELAIERLVGRDRLAAALPIYREYWDRTMLDDVALMPGARELVAALHARGAKLGVFTNKLGTSSRLICDHLGVTPFFHAIVGAKDTPWLKPQPEFAAHVLGQLGATAASALLVGDSTYDVQAAHNGGFPCWAVTTGTHDADELRAARADAIFPDLFALRAALEK